MKGPQNDPEKDDQNHYLAHIDLKPFYDSHQHWGNPVAAATRSS